MKSSSRQLEVKTCKHCGAVEWPCFFVLGACRMCQARHRDTRGKEKP
jgi:hypothetical protein